MDHPFERIGNANVMFYSGHLILEGVEGIPEVLAQNDCHRFRVIDDESALLRVKTEINGNRSYSSLEAGKKGFNELWAVV
jgi:hypothetical protein